MMTHVYNLYTGESAYYSLRPHDAVLAAHMQFDKKNHNSWSYPSHGDVVKVSQSGKTVLAGNWCALTS